MAESDSAAKKSSYLEVVICVVLIIVGALICGGDITHPNMIGGLMMLFGVIGLLAGVYGYITKN